MPSKSPAPRDTRIVGAVLLLGSAVQLSAAGMVKPEVFTAADPLAKLQAIERSGRGWARQAVLFPVAFALVTAAFGMLHRLLQGSARRWAATAMVLSALSTLLWLPITRGRLTVGREVHQLIQRYQPGMRVSIAGEGGWAFWPYTGAALTSVAAAGTALVASRLRRKTGIGVLLASTVIPAVVIARWRDWPPFATYLLTASVGLSLIFRLGNPDERKS